MDAKTIYKRIKNNPRFSFFLDDQYVMQYSMLSGFYLVDIKSKLARNMYISPSEAMGLIKHNLNNQC